MYTYCCGLQEEEVDWFNSTRRQTRDDGCWYQREFNRFFLFQLSLLLLRLFQRMSNVISLLKAESGARTAIVHTYGATTTTTALSLSLAVCRLQTSPETDTLTNGIQFKLRQNCDSQLSRQFVCTARRDDDDDECHAHSSPARFCHSLSLLLAAAVAAVWY